MSLTTADLITEIQMIVGDLSDQFGLNVSSDTSVITLRVKTELANTLRWLTTNYTMYWNVRHSTGLGHTEGVVAAPPNMAKILLLSDSEGNDRYRSCPYEEFYMIKDNVNREITYGTSTSIPFLVTVNPVTGNENIEVATFEDTSTTRTFNLVYTEYTDFVDGTTLSAWIPDRLRVFLTSFTAAQLLTKMDSPDSNLIQLHTSIARTALKDEVEYGANKSFVKFNSNGIWSQNTRVNIKGSYSL